MESQKGPWRLQLSIRTLFEVTALAAVIIAIWFTRGGGNPPTPQIVADPRRGLIIYDPATNKCWQFQQPGDQNIWYPFDGPPELGK